MTSTDKGFPFPEIAGASPYKAAPFARGNHHSHWSVFKGQIGVERNRNRFGNVLEAATRRKLSDGIDIVFLLE